MTDHTGHLGTDDVAVDRADLLGRRGADRALAGDAGDAVRLPAVFTPIATRAKDHGGWTRIPKALMSPEEAYELEALGQAVTKESPDGLGLRLVVLSVRAAQP